MWVALTLDQRARLLGRARDAAGAVAEELGEDAATISKGLEPGHPYRGRGMARRAPRRDPDLLDALRETIEALAKGWSPLDGVTIDQAPGGRLRAHTFPLNGTEEVPAVGVHRRGLVRARRDRRSGAPRSRAGAS